MSHPRFTRIVDQLPATVPFVGPETLMRQRERAFKARIGANESVFGPSPKVIDAIRKAAPDVWMYADPENHDLKADLAAFHGVSTDNINIGEGIDGLLGYAARLFIEPGDAVVTSLGGYPTFNYHVNGFGGRLVEVPYRDNHEDCASLIAAAARERARIVYIANPDNPMGTWHSASVIEETIRSLPSGTLLILDEAYADTAPPGTIPEFDVTNPNVLRFRTFSKAYGMAGMRVGYVIGAPEVVSAFNKIRNHFGMARLSQVAAQVALADQAYLRMAVANIAEARDRITAIAAANGLEALASATNFVAVDCGQDGAFAKRVLEQLIARDIFVRMPGVAPLNRCIRISAGRSQELDELEAAFPAALAAATG